MKFKQHYFKMFIGGFLIFTILISSSTLTSSYSTNDPINDITYLIDGVYQGQGYSRPSIDMKTIEYNGTHAIMELVATPNESELTLYYIWFYWSDVVVDNTLGVKSPDAVNVWYV